MINNPRVGKNVRMLVFADAQTEAFAIKIEEHKPAGDVEKIFTTKDFDHSGEEFNGLQEFRIELSNKFQFQAGADYQFYVAQSDDAGQMLGEWVRANTTEFYGGNPPIKLPSAPVPVAPAQPSPTPVANQTPAPVTTPAPSAPVATPAPTPTPMIQTTTPAVQAQAPVPVVPAQPSPTPVVTQPAPTPVVIQNPPININVTGASPSAPAQPTQTPPTPPPSQPAVVESKGVDAWMVGAMVIITCLICIICFGAYVLKQKGEELKKASTATTASIELLQKELADTKRQQAVVQPPPAPAPVPTPKPETISSSQVTKDTKNGSGVILINSTVTGGVWNGTMAEKKWPSNSDPSMIGDIGTNCPKVVVVIPAGADYAYRIPHGYEIIPTVSVDARVAYNTGSNDFPDWNREYTGGLVWSYRVNNPTGKPMEASFEVRQKRISS